MTIILIYSGKAKGDGRIGLWQFLAADIEGVEGIGAVGAVLEQVFLALGELFAGLVLTETVAPTDDTCRLDGEN